MFELSSFVFVVEEFCLQALQALVKTSQGVSGSWHYSLGETRDPEIIIVSSRFLRWSCVIAHQSTSSC